MGFNIHAHPCTVHLFVAAWLFLSFLLVVDKHRKSIATQSQCAMSSYQSPKCWLGWGTLSAAHRIAVPAPQWPLLLKSRVERAGTSKALQCFSAISCRLAMRNMNSKSSKRSRSACFGAAAALFCVVGTSTMKLESSSSTANTTSISLAPVAF